MDLEADIKVLTGEEVRPISDTGLEPHPLGYPSARGSSTYWSGGKTQPRSGQPPRRWKVWATAHEANSAAAAMKGLIVRSKC
jgi:hypothetical protein